MADVLEVGYAVYPSVKMMKPVVDPKTGVKSMHFLKELLFGDRIEPAILKRTGDYSRHVVDGVEYIRVSCRRRNGYIRECDMQATPVLEVNFIDVGQGDGCHVVTPDDQHFVIDAGEGDNMFRFLKWRFNLEDTTQTPPPLKVVISHSDTDHYAGFEHVFTPVEGLAKQLSFEKIYHNGMVESSGDKPSSLGTVLDLKDQGYAFNKYITDLCDTPEDYEERVKSLRDNKKVGTYVRILELAHVDKVALRKGMDPIYDDHGLKIEVMGPVAEKIDGKDALPYFGSTAETKNGHSVILMLTMGRMKILLGGDLNTKSEYYLIKEYSGIDIKAVKAELKKKISAERRAELEAQYEEAITKAREALQVDVAKSCHHGSADFSTEFLDVINPIATVISSGDEEQHCHPRPETLGTIGKHSRGDRSLIFSTELARSSKEFVDFSNRKETDSTLERTVTVYGMINVRTDGEKAIIAQKLEKPASGRGWQIHELRWNAKKGEFEYVSST